MKAAIPEKSGADKSGPAKAGSIKAGPAKMGRHGGYMRKILLLMPDNLLGFVRALGPARELRRFFNSAKIVAVGPSALADLANGCPAFDASDRYEPGAERRALGDLIRRIKANGFDLALDLGRNATTRRIADSFRFDRLHWVAPAGAADLAGPSLSAYAGLLAALGVRDQNDAPWTRPPRPDVSWARMAQRDAPRLQAEHFGVPGPFALFALGAPGGFEAEGWPSGAFAELCGRIGARGVSPVLIGPESERETAAAISRQCSHAKSLIGRVDYFQIACLAERAMAVVGVETGHFQLALAAGAPGVVLFPTQSLPAAPIAPTRQLVMLHGAQISVIRPAEVETALAALGAFDSAGRPNAPRADAS